MLRINVINGRTNLLTVLGSEISRGGLGFWRPAFHPFPCTVTVEYGRLTVDHFSTEIRKNVFRAPIKMRCTQNTAKKQHGKTGETKTSFNAPHELTMVR